MAHIRKLPSGNWQAIVRVPAELGGGRLPRTDPLRTVVKDWAADTEADMRRGIWRDPRKREVLTLAQWYERWSKERVVESETARGNARDWRLHLRDQLGEKTLDDLTAEDVRAWVKKRDDAKAPPAATVKALAHLKACLEGAVEARLVDANVARAVQAPTVPIRLPEWLTRAEVEALADALRKAGRESDAVLAEFMAWTGLRWGEAVALRGDDIDWLRRRVKVNHTLTQHGKDKPHPKNSPSIREVPVPPRVLKMMSALLAGREPGARIFVTQNGRDLTGANWRDDVAVICKKAGVKYASPHKLRHTAASWLAQDGVPLYDIKDLLGHGSIKTTERYSHLQPGKSKAVTEAWKRLDARVTHAKIRKIRKGS